MNPLNIGFPSLILILIVLLIIFGPNKLPELGRSIGLTLKEFKDTTKNLTSFENENNQKSSSSKDRDS